MGKFPVISISLKSVNAENFDKAKAQLVKIINREARRLRSFLRIEYLEKDSQLQDLVLSVFHATTHTFSSTPAMKIIENQNGKAFIKIQN